MQQNEEVFFVLLFGPHTDRRDISYLLNKRLKIRNEIKKEWPHSDIVFIEDNDIQKHLAEIKKTATKVGGRYDYINVLLKHYAPAADIYFFLVSKETDGAMAEAEKLGMHPLFGTRCHIIYDSDDYEMEKPMIGQGTYSSRIKDLEDGSDSQFHRPATVAGYSRQAITDCDAWAAIKQHIRAFLYHRAELQQRGFYRKVII